MNESWYGIMPYRFFLTIWKPQIVLKNKAKPERRLSGNTKLNFFKMEQLTLTDEQIENIVRRSYQYVAMYNTNNNFAMQYYNPYLTGGWNKMYIPEGLADHTLTAIPRPNNDTLYLMSLLDLRDDAVVIEFPRFDSKYVSLEASAYDHYVEIPLSTTYEGEDHFRERKTVLFYTKRTKGYDETAEIEGIDLKVEMTGDFSIAFLRVAPHANDTCRMNYNLCSMQTQKLMTLSEFKGEEKKPVTPVKFPDFSTDQEVFRHNFLEVMQFAFNHTTFDPLNKMDREVLDALKPLGVEPKKIFRRKDVAQINGKRFAEIAEEVARECLAIWNDPGNPYLTKCFLPKGEMTIKPMTIQSAVGPIGLPAHQAQYPGIGTPEGEPPMNAQHHYVIEMTKEQLPPATAFWSATLYDSVKGLFIPNEHYKYSVGENGGIQLDEDGGVAIHIAPTQPEEVPLDNWLPSGGKDEQLDIIMRVYAPDLEKMSKWTAPKAIKQS